MRLISRVLPANSVHIFKNTFAVIDVTHYQAQKYLNIMQQLKQIQKASQTSVNFLSLLCDNISFFGANFLFLPDWISEGDSNFQRILNLHPDEREAANKGVKIFADFIIFYGKIVDIDTEVETFELTKSALEVISHNLEKYSPSDFAKVPCF